MVICGGKGSRRCSVKTHGGGATKLFLLGFFFFNFFLSSKSKSIFVSP